MLQDAYHFTPKIHRPFTSVDTVAGVSVQWTLGVVALEAADDSMCRGGAGAGGGGGGVGLENHPAKAGVLVVSLLLLIGGVRMYQPKR
jgi:hypothetical protein